MLVFEPEFKGPRQALPDVLEPILETFNVIEDLLNVPLALLVLIQREGHGLRVQRVQVLSELKVRLLPLIGLDLLNEVLEVVFNCWIAWVDLDLQLNLQQLCFLINHLRHPRVGVNLLCHLLHLCLDLVEVVLQVDIGVVRILCLKDKLREFKFKVYDLTGELFTFNEEAASDD